jgi:hypothetical protein
MPSTKSLSARLPERLFSPRLRSWDDDAWALAAAGRVVAVGVYLLGYVVLVLSHADDFTFRGFWQVLFAKNFLIASPATLIAVAAIGLHRDRAARATPRGARLVDVALVGALALAALCLIGSAVALVADLPDLGDDFGVGFEEVMFDLAAFIAAATAGVWALLEVDHRRQAALAAPAG